MPLRHHDLASIITFGERGRELAGKNLPFLGYESSAARAASSEIVSSCCTCALWLVGEGRYLSRDWRNVRGGGPFHLNVNDREVALAVGVTPNRVLTSTACSTSLNSQNSIALSTAVSLGEGRGRYLGRGT